MICDNNRTDRDLYNIVTTLKIGEVARYRVTNAEYLSRLPGYLTESLPRP